MELQDIARGGNRGRMSGRGKREREVKTGRGIGQDKDVKTAGEDGTGRETKKGGKLNITRRSGRVRTLGTIPKAGSRPPETRDYRIYRLSAKEWVVYGCMGISACAVVAYTFYRSFMAFLIMMPAGLLFPLYKKRDLKQERTRQLGLQFKEGILVLASYLGAGYSLENGLAMCTGELEGISGKQGMITEEFAILASGVRMNRPVELLLMELGARSGLEDVEHFAQVFAAARRSGGELVGIINYTAGIIRDKVQVQEEIHTMTASREFEQKIMNGIPFLIVLYIDLTSPGFFRVMYETMMGRAVMTICLAVYLGAWLLSKRILEIEV